MPEIDGMDVCYYIRLLGYSPKSKSNHEQTATPLVTDEHGNKGLYIDQFGIF